MININRLVYSLVSYLTYEGSTFHGVFETKNLAKQAKEYLISKGFSEYDRFELESIHIGGCFVPQCEDIYPTKFFYPSENK